MTQDETSAKAEPINYSLRIAELELEAAKILAEHLNPPAAPYPEGHLPEVVALSRLETSGRKFAQRTRAMASDAELTRLTSGLLGTLSSDADLDVTLRTQAALMNHAFTALLMKTTRDDEFDEIAFTAALRAQRQYRLSCHTLGNLKKAQERTEMNRQKASRETRPGDGIRHRFDDPFADAGADAGTDQ